MSSGWRQEQAHVHGVSGHGACRGVTELHRADGRQHAGRMWKRAGGRKQLTR